MAKAGAGPRPEWEQLPDSGQRIYLALAEGDLERARQLYQGDQVRVIFVTDDPTKAAEALSHSATMGT